MAYDESLSPPESGGTFILPILERMDEVSKRQIDTDVRLEKTLTALLKFLEGYGGDFQGGRSGSPGKSPQKNPLQPQNPSNLMNILSWMGEKKDKTLDVIKKGFFKLFKTDYFTNLFKAINNLAKALTNSFMSWLKFFIMMAFIDPSGGFLRDIINLFAEIGMLLFKIITPLIPVAIKMMFDTIVYVFKLVLSLIPQIITTIMQTFTQLGNTFPILKPIIKFINQFLSALRSLFIILNNPKADKSKGFESFLNKVFKILGAIIEKLLDLVVEYAPKIFKYVVDFIANTVIPGLIEYVPKILDKFSEGLDFLIKKYPNLAVWIQPFKDLLDMISAFIGSFAKFDESEYIKGLDDYKKQEQQLMQTRQFQLANEQKRLEMLSNVQYAYAVANKDAIKKAKEDFEKMNDDKLNLAKQKWSDFLSHALDTLGAAYDKLPDTAKIALWSVALIKVFTWLVSIGTWIMESMEILLSIGRGLATVGGWLLRLGGIILSVFKFIGSAIATFIGGLSATALAIIAVVLLVIGLVWYFWDDIVDFLSGLGDMVSDWWDNLDIMKSLSEIGESISDWWNIMITSISDFFSSFTKEVKDMASSVIDFFIEPIKNLISEFLGFINNIELPDWINPKNWFSGMGGGTDEDEIKKSIEARRKLELQADKKYYSSSAFIIEEKKKEALKINKLDQTGAFDNYSQKFSKSLQTALEKEPINIKNLPKALTPTEVKPSFNYDWKEVFSSLDNFKLFLSVTFDNIMFSIKKSFSSFMAAIYEKISLPIFNPERFAPSKLDELKALRDMSTSENIKASRELTELINKIESKGLSKRVAEDLLAGRPVENIDEHSLSTILGNDLYPVFKELANAIKNSKPLTLTQISTYFSKRQTR